ncbi:MAG: YbjN domain-containing protein [Armatimonadetes bacterium]|nr:YbjN domain-containing protein [Armatimonadota bacterium]
MEFKHNAHREAYEKTKQYLLDSFGSLVHVFEEVPGFALPYGSAVAFIRVLPWRDEAVVCTRAYVVTGVEHTPELMEFLLRSNADFVFGAFGFDEDGDITFEHTILATHMDPDELRDSVMAVLWTADTFDDQIVQRFGGVRALDKMRGIP